MDPSRHPGDDVRRLLALKRHEQPPPGYFEYLHHQVVNRIALENEPEPEDWFGSLWERFRLRPALVGAFSIALGAFYLAGVGSSNQPAPQPAGAPWQVYRLGSLDRRSVPVRPPWMAPLAPRETHTTSITPVVHPVPVAPAPVPWHPYASGSIAPAAYLVPAR